MYLKHMKYMLYKFEFNYPTGLLRRRQEGLKTFFWFQIWEPKAILWVQKFGLMWFFDTLEYYMWLSPLDNFSHLLS